MIDIFTLQKYEQFLIDLLIKSDYIFFKVEILPQNMGREILHLGM